MSKFGLYDPSSIHAVAGGILAINFINAQNAADVTTIRMDTEAKVHSVMAGLDNQVANKMTIFGGEVSKLSGVLRMNQEDPGFGIMTDENNKIVPVRLAFAVTAEDLPENGICMAVGAFDDGAFEIFKMAVHPITPEQVLEMAPAAEPKVSESDDSDPYP